MTAPSSTTVPVTGIQPLADNGPFTIASIPINIPLTLAPMAGYTDYAYRHVIRQLGGCGLLYTELISSEALVRRNKKTLNVFVWSEDERPVAVQIYGSEPSVMAAAAQNVQARGAEIIDINMGCWVPKLAKKGSGAALMRDINVAARVVEAVVQAVDVPVTVKIRSGWDEGHPTALEFARAAEAVGVQMIAVHARYARQGFTGAADWSVIRAVKEAVSIPVIGNGDVTNTAEARRMFQETGCDVVMIGRAARGNPWLFRMIDHELRTGEPLPPPTSAERAAIALHHVRMAMDDPPQGAYIMALELRRHFTRYRLDKPGAPLIRKQLVQCTTLAEIEAVLLPLARDVDPAASSWVDWNPLTE
ncbi:tRNA dihydrouridine synthase DusB [Chloroflexota bacterium]